MRRIAAVCALLGLGLACAVLAANGHATSPAVSKVTVTATEFRFTLSKRSVPLGTVVFTVVNKGKGAHNFRIAGKTTPVIRPGRSATLRVTFTKKGRYAYLCTIAGHAAAGMKGTLAVATLPVAPTPTQVTATTTETGPATTVAVDMFEFRYDLSAAGVPAGKVTFVVTNRGAETHNFDLAGVKAGAYLSPGKTETWTVALAPGSYTFRCDVPFHADRGMVGQLTVS